METDVAAQSAQVLELPMVLDMVARHATWKGGREAVLALRPAGSRDEVLDRQAEVAEAMHLDETFAVPPLRGMRDVLEWLQAARRGQTLEPSALLDIGQVLRVAIQTRRFLTEREVEVPRMAARAAVLSPFPQLLDELDATLTSDGEIRESASPRLEEIRIKARTLQNRVQTKLQSILRNPGYSRMFQEPYITTRQERYVLPIKAEYRGQFQGLVIDASASGATVFMEPYGVVDLDNELRELRIAETHEVQRILRVLSERLGGVADEVASNGEILSHLDMLIAVARFGAEHHAMLVPIDSATHTILRRARHPLLGARAVPIDIEVGVAGARVVVITGANTGGKTVTLKTVGLLSLMAMCGLPISVAEGSRVGFLQGVYADIGDEQSIQQNLSTFSSHLMQISRILPRAQTHTLVLLDEVGAGTDPREGTALGVSILEHLHAQGAIVVCTTHYNELKTFATNFEGAVNAAMEFDARTLQPTYRILMGMPGRSCALEISQRLGLAPEILQRTRELLGASHFSVEDLLINLEIEREEAGRQNRLTERAYEEAVALRAQLRQEAELRELERAQMRADAAREAQHVIEAARAEARRLLSDARGHLAALYHAAERGQRHALNESAAQSVVGQENEAEKKDLSPASVTLRVVDGVPISANAAPIASSDAMRAVDDEEGRLRRALEEASTVYREMRGEAEAEARKLGRPPEVAAMPELSTPLRAGDGVYVARLGREATVIDVGRNDVQVMAGNMRMTLPRQGVRKVRDAATSFSGEGEVVVRTAAGRSGAERKAAASTRLDLRGMRAEDAGYALDRYLDEVATAGVDRVTIVHGKGTGVLLNVVQERLKGHPRVEAFRLGDPGEGGWGVTVVTLQ